MCIPPKRRPASWRAKRGRPVLARKDDYRERYTVEIVHPQMTKPNGGTMAGGGEDRADLDIADLDIAVGDNDAINQEFDECAPLVEGGLMQTHPHLRAEVL